MLWPAGLFLTVSTEGFRARLARLLHWRVSARWYAVALLLAPMVILAMLLALSITSPVFVPGLIATDDKAGRLAFGLTAALVTGVLEELGWTGFATPRLRARYSIFATGLIIGVPWGAWHIIGSVGMASGTYAGDLSLPIFVAGRTIGLLVGALPAYRVLMVWVYDRTGSLLVAVLMHVSLTAATLTLEPLAISGRDLLLHDLVSAIAWWGIVAVVALSTRGRLTQRPVAPRMA
jgi:membrane protease YdiL (CAAX protease family)